MQQVAKVIAIEGDAEEQRQRERESGCRKEQGQPARSRPRRQYRGDGTEHRQQYKPGKRTSKYHNYYSLFYERDQHKHQYGQQRDTAKETNHVGLYPASLNVPQVTPGSSHRRSYSVDDAINNVGIKGCLHVRETKHAIADNQRVQLADVEPVQRHTMQEVQRRVIVDHLPDFSPANDSVEVIRPAEADKCNHYTHPRLPVGENVA